jgi:hypothetical protein
MLRARLFVAVCACLFLAGLCLAADPPTLMTAQGTVEKVEKDSLTIRPRGPDGKFGKNLVLQVTGTSKVTTLLPQSRAGKLVMTQKDTDAKDLQPKQTIAVIYTEGTPPVLLAAVVQPTSEK